MTQRAISRRDFLHLATATSAGALIAACAPPAGQTGSGGDAGSAMEEVTIEFWVNQPMARSEGLWDTLMAEYEELNPGVTVNSLIIPTATTSLRSSQALPAAPSATCSTSIPCTTPPWPCAARSCRSTT